MYRWRARSWWMEAAKARTSKISMGRPLSNINGRLPANDNVPYSTYTKKSYSCIRAILNLIQTKNRSFYISSLFGVVKPASI